MQIKTTLEYCFLPIRLSNRKSLTKSAIGKAVGKDTPNHITREYKMFHCLWKLDKIKKNSISFTQESNF